MNHPKQHKKWFNFHQWIFLLFCILSITPALYTPAEGAGIAHVKIASGDGSFEFNNNAIWYTAGNGEQTSATGCSFYISDMRNNGYYYSHTEASGFWSETFYSMGRVNVPYLAAEIHEYYKIYYKVAPVVTISSNKSQPIFNGVESVNLPYSVRLYPPYNGSSEPNLSSIPVTYIIQKKTGYTVSLIITGGGSSGCPDPLIIPQSIMSEADYPWLWPTNPRGLIYNWGRSYSLTEGEVLDWKYIFTPNIYTVTISSIPNGKVATETVYAAYDSSFSYTPPPVTGYTYTSYSFRAGSSTPGNPSFIYKTDDNASLVLTYSPNPYIQTIQEVCTGNEPSPRILSSSTQTAYYDSTATFTRTSRVNYTFKKWKKNNIDYSTNATIAPTIDGAATWTAVYEEHPDAVLFFSPEF